MDEEEKLAKAAGGVPVDVPETEEDVAKAAGGREVSPAGDFLSDQWDSLKKAAPAFGSQFVDSIANAASGLKNVAEHPLDTVDEITHSLGDTSLNDIGSGLNRIGRNIPIVGPALNMATSTPEQRKAQAIEDQQHAEHHPVTDFLQKSLPLYVLPEGIPAQVATLAADTFTKSRAAGKSYTDSIHDALNTAALSGSTLGAFKAPGAIGRQTAKELGVSQEAIARRIEEPEAIDRAQQYVNDPEALKNAIDQKVAPINQAVDAAQEGVANAKQGIADTKLPPQDLASEIPAHLDTQGAKLKAISNQAIDILNDEGHTIGANDLSGATANQMDSLKVGGVVPSIGPDAQAYSSLGKFKDMVDEVGNNYQDGQLPAPVVKQLIQQLDGVSKDAYTTNAGALSPAAAQNLAAVRRTFDQVLKQASPAYEAKMAELSPQVQLVNDMSKMFGNEQTAMTALKAAADPMTPKGLVVRQKLGEYDAQNGTDFLPRVTDFYDKPKQNLAAAQQTLQGAQDQAANVNLLSPNSTEGVVNALKGGRNIEARKQLEGLSPELAQTAQDTQYANEFSRPTINGSRRVNTGGFLGGSIGGAIGGLIGHGAGMVLGDAAIGHAIGGGIGAVGGFLADRYGGEAVKAAVDAGIKLDKLANTPYIAPLMKAAQESPKALAVTHYMLSQTDPGYQKLINDNH